MKINIYEDNNFVIYTSSERPHISREDGGHICIIPKVRVEDRTKLSPQLAKEYIKLSMVAGEALMKVMNEHGIDVGRINYQENGNWGVFEPDGPFMHEHIYGRAKSSKLQTYGQALILPERNSEYYSKTLPLTQEEIDGLKQEIERLLATDKYKNF